MLLMNVTCDLNNSIESVAESVILTLVFLKGMPSVHWDTFHPHESFGCHYWFDIFKQDTLLKLIIFVTFVLVSFVKGFGEQNSTGDLLLNMNSC